jgi:hypothetical protein
MKYLILAVALLAAGASPVLFACHTDAECAAVRVSFHD